MEVGTESLEVGRVRKETGGRGFDSGKKRQKYREWVGGSQQGRMIQKVMGMPSVCGIKVDGEKEESSKVVVEWMEVLGTKG